MRPPGVPIPDDALARTKIIATLGPASSDPDTIHRLVEAGVSVFRINFAHGEHDTHRTWIESVRTASEQTGHPTGVLVDLAGPKIRVRGLPGGRLDLVAGTEVRLVGTDAPSDGSIPVDEPRLLRDLKRGDPVFLADGSMELKVAERGTDEVTCRVVTGGLLVEGKGVNVPRTKLRLPAMTEQDRTDLEAALDWDVDVVALSFVRRAKDLQLARKMLADSKIPLYAKIEKAEAAENLDEIVDASDGVMVARGDLGVETPLVDIPVLQKRIIRTANARAKPVITATQMLRSMVDNPHPTRAEATDVANAILDGTDAVMLSEETAMGRHPVAAVRTMAAIAHSAEATLPPGPRPGADEPTGIAADALAVSRAAVELAEAMEATAIVTPTRSGATARHIARLRPPMPILAMTRHRHTYGGLLMSWGVRPLLEEHHTDLEEVIRVAGTHLVAVGLAKGGDAFLLTAGYPAGQADSNLLTVQRVPKKATKGRTRRRTRKK